MARGVLDEAVTRERELAEAIEALRRDMEGAGVPDDAGLRARMDAIADMVLKLKADKENIPAPHAAA